MARLPSPWFWEERGEWCVNLNGQRRKLCPHPEGFPPPRKSRGRWNVPQPVLQMFHELMAQANQAKPETRSIGLSVADVFEKFLDWCIKHRAPATYEFLRYRIQLFVDALDAPEKLAVSELKPFHVVEWIDQHDTWGDTFRRNLITAIQRPLNWAVKLGYIDKNPLLGIEKPACKRREQIVTVEDWINIRDSYDEGDSFRDILEFCWETGCRPQEARRIEDRHVQIDNHRIVFPKEEAKGKKVARVIYMTPRAEEIIVRSMGDEIVFRNADGAQWTPMAMNCRFSRLKEKLGTKFAAYSLRHGFATRKLESGLDHLTVAALMGHQDGTMLSRVYSHVGDRQDYLREKLNES